MQAISGLRNDIQLRVKDKSLSSQQSPASKPQAW